VFLII